MSLNSVDDVNTTFKVGDKVCKFGDADVKTILEVFNDGYMQLTNLLTSGLTSNLK